MKLAQPCRVTTIAPTALPMRTARSSGHSPPQSPDQPAREGVPCTKHVQHLNRKRRNGPRLAIQHENGCAFCAPLDDQRLGPESSSRSIAWSIDPSLSAAARTSSSVPDYDRRARRQETEHDSGVTRHGRSTDRDDSRGPGTPGVRPLSPGPPQRVSPRGRLVREAGAADNDDRTVLNRRRQHVVTRQLTVCAAFTIVGQGKRSGGWMVSMTALVRRPACEG